MTLQAKAWTEDTITYHSELCFKQDIASTTGRVTSFCISISWLIAPLHMALYESIRLLSMLVVT